MAEARLAVAVGGVIALAITGQAWSDGPNPQGAAALQAVCGRCHSLQLVTSQPRSEEDWARVFETMANLGARATDEQFEAIQRYIRSRLTVVDVNTASRDELLRWLPTPGPVADAIVARRALRPFRDLPDLETVPGVDAGTLEVNRSRIRF